MRGTRNEAGGSDCLTSRESRKNKIVVLIVTKEHRNIKGRQKKKKMENTLVLRETVPESCDEAWRRVVDSLRDWLDVALKVENDGDDDDDDGDIYIRVEDCSDDDDWSTASSEEEESEEDDEDSDDGDDGEYGSSSSSDEEESEDGEDGDSTTSEDSDDDDDDESTTSGDEESDDQSDDEESDGEDMLRGSGLSAIRLCQRCDVCVADDLEEDSDFGDWWGD
jgi:cobalamin biosynthesis protein CobT